MSVAVTALGLRLKATIAREGALSVGSFMQACLHDPDDGYYRTRAAIGTAGDFVTAPEISQIFGELIGLWCAVVWRALGAPRAFDLIEFGPGRGTLLKDALRATRIVPGFHDAARLCLVESDATFRAEQKRTLAGSGPMPAWFESTADTLDACAATDAPTLVIANEFLDALPIEQFVFEDGQWRLRQVALDVRGEFHFVSGPPSSPPPEHVARNAKTGDIWEVRPQAHHLAEHLGRLAASHPIAALFIDYGHVQSGMGDTLQAIRAHAHASPLDRPGETDITALVDFEAFGSSARRAGLGCDGPISQAEFLGRLGMVERASGLMAANADKAAAIEAGVARLMAPTGMGSRFKVLGLRNACMAPLPGLENVDT